MSTRRKIVISFILAGVVSVLAMISYLYWQTRSIVDEFDAGAKHRVVQAALPELNKTPKDPVSLERATNILLIGADARHGESGRGRSDTLMLMRINPRRGTISLLSVPRDLKVNIPGYGVNKINAAYAFGGPKLAIATVRETFGVTINHFAEVNMGGFRSIISSVGGAFVPVDQRYYHKNNGTYAGNWSSIDIKPGYQKLTSSRALQFARFRHSDSDYQRAARQQIVVREVGRQIKAKKSDPLKLRKVIKAVARATTSDIHKTKDALGIAYAMRKVSADNIYRSTIVGTGSMIGGASYQVATPSQVHAAVMRWAYPQRTTKTPPNRVPKAPSASPSLMDVSARAKNLVAPLYGPRRCYPSKLPSGYSFPQNDAARRYSLEGHQTAALYATAGSGRSVLWMYTEWQNAPILHEPTRAIRRGGKTYFLYTDSGKVRMIAWLIGETRVWITNTLQNDLNKQTMIALANSCVTL